MARKSSQERVQATQDGRSERADSFDIGDTVEVQFRVVEGGNERIEIFNGVVVQRSGHGLHEMFTVRRIVQGEGVERRFKLHSPWIADVAVKRSGKVRRTRLYYLRDRSGKAVRLKERFSYTTGADAKAAKAERRAARAARKASKVEAEVAPSSKTKQPKEASHRTASASDAGPAESEGTVAGSSIDAVFVPGKSPYRLKQSIALTVVETRSGVTIRSADLGLERDLVGRGPDWNSAMNDFGRRFDLLVENNWALPPHSMTLKNRRIASILDSVVDWKRHDDENPLVQPMWGRLQGRLADGALTIHWLIGPNGDRDAEGGLHTRDVPEALAELDTGQWFYGTAKCYPDHIEWIEQPSVVPDPSDSEGRRAVWDSMRKVQANQPGCWPVKPR